MSFKMTFRILSLVTLGLFPQAALAEIRVPIYGLLDQARYASGSAKESGSFAPGGGAGIELPLGTSSSVEIDALYVTRKTSATSHYVTVPLLYRLWLGSSFSLGLGGYYASALGEISTGSARVTYAEAGYDTKDFGALAAAALHARLGGLNCLVEGRYQFGMYNISNVSGITAKFDDIQILVGVRLGGGK